MSRTSIFVAPILALFSSSFYREVGQFWRGKSFLYLLLLEIVCWIPPIFLLSVAVKEWVADDAPKLIDQVPPITINKGIVSVDVPQPHYVRYNGETVAIIDTTGEVKSLEGTGAKLLLTKKELITDNGNGQTRHYDLHEVDGVSLTPEMLHEGLNAAASWGPYAIYAVVVPLTFIGRIFQALFYSLFGLIIGKIVGAKVTYGGVLSVTLMALTAPILFGTVLMCSGLSLPFPGWIGFGLAMGYLTFGLSANQESTEYPSQDYANPAPPSPWHQS